MPLDLKNINKKKVGFFRFKELDGSYLLTNDIGEYSFLNPQEFNLFLTGKIEQTLLEKYAELQDKGFIRDMLDLDGLSQKYAKKNLFLGQGTCLHIIVVTLQCGHKCIYCQGGAQELGLKQYDMDLATAQKAVDRIFESPNPNINIEFQGGEPLANFDTIKFIIEYALKINKKHKKNLDILLVSNLAFMTEKKLQFLMKNNISICTSLDGPEKLHNKCRIERGGKSSYKNTIKWLKLIKKHIKKSSNYKYNVNALATITKYSLFYPEEIIDEYIDLDLEGVHLRPVNPFGLNKKIWQKIEFSAEEFLSFYKKALNYIIKLNLKGKNFYERTARIFLMKILTDEDPNFLDLRSPCGAGIGQLAYNFNGDVYTCDEGRMLSVVGDESFRVGNVARNTYDEFIESEAVKVACLASCINNIPGCNECVYMPYCGACPIYNYVVGNSLFFPFKKSQRCKINMGIIDYLFTQLKKDDVKKVFTNWVQADIKTEIRGD